MKFIFFFILFLSSIPLTHATSGLQERALLMKFMIQAESKQKLELEWTTSWWKKIKLIEEAHAYKEGETCLVLGFKSQFKKGMCRLSLAEGAKSYKAQCSAGTLPCNPQIFGKPSSEKPFCVSASSGKELSKYCSYKSFSHLAEKSKGVKLSPDAKKAITSIQQMNAKSFDLDKIDVKSLDQSMGKQVEELFSAADSNIESAVSFLKGLCGDLKTATQTGDTSLDLKNCEAQLEMLETLSEPKETQGDQGSSRSLANDQTNVPAPSKEEVVTDAIKQTPDSELCVQPNDNGDVIEEKIKDITKVVETSTAGAWWSCMEQLDAHPDLAEGARGHFWHEIEGQKTFGKHCKYFNEDEKDQKLLAFMTPKGFQVLEYPVFHYKVPNELGGSDSTSLPRNVLKFRAGSRDYYVSEFDNIGDYFDTVSEDKFDAFIRGIEYNPQSVKAKYVTKYETYLRKAGKPTQIKLTPAENSKVGMDEAKSCIKDQMERYVDILLIPAYNGHIPHFEQMQKDLKGDRNSEILKKRYQRDISQIKEEVRIEAMGKAPACKDIISPEDFSKIFDQTFGKRYENYEKLKRYFNP